MTVPLLAFLLIRPYSYLASTISLDFGRKRAPVTARGLIDSAGYLFGGVIPNKMVLAVSGSF
jgi:sugar phosphate permease